MKIVKKKILKLSKYINIIENTVKVDNSLEKYHSFSQSDYVSILAISKKNKIILVKQFRPALKKNTIELPGGLRDKKEKHSITAKRELYEETGYSAGKLTFLGSFHPSGPAINCTLWPFSVGSQVIVSPTATLATSSL